MPQTTQFAQIGGVDSRSNVLTMPLGRARRMRNWVPKEDGSLELRRGYSRVTMDSVIASPIHSIFHYRQLDGTKYLIFAYGNTVKKINLSTHAVTTPTVKGAAIASSEDWTGVFVNNRFQMSNGTDSKWTDGSMLRDTGLPALTAEQVANVIVYESVREASSAERSAVTVTGNAGGGLGATSKGGILFYVAYFDTATQERGPATQYVGSGRYNFTANQKADLASLPNLSSIGGNLVKLLAITEDGGYIARFCTNTNTAITSISRVDVTLTVTAAGHGLSTGDVVVISGNGDDAWNDVWAVTVTDADHFTVLVPTTIGGETAPGGTVKRIVKVANATTTGTVTDNTVDSSVQANDDRGLPSSTVTSGALGYQFYISIYNANGGGHVGNCIAIGRRINPSSRCNIRVAGLPNLALIHNEWDILFGRTVDGGAVPSPIADLAGNWKFIPNGTLTTFISESALDPNREMPTRNGVPPGFAMMWRTDDYLWGVPPNSATLYRSGSLIDDRAGNFTGRPEQSWAPNDIETFPTGAKITCAVEYAGQSWVFSHSDMSVFLIVGGVPQGWDPSGPWNVGCAGKRAFARGWKNQPYWVTGDKQIATMTAAGPHLISEEYEKALLSRIGDAYLSEVELVYELRPDKGYDRLIVNARDASGNPFQVFHDFKIADARSSEGQGYDGAYRGALTSPFTLAEVRDANDLAKVYAGGTDGRLYEISGSEIDDGTEFTADAIMVVNAGPNRPVLEHIEWWGDRKVVWNFSEDLNANIADFEEIQTTEVKTEDNHYSAEIGREVGHAVIRMQLTSHSADGSLALNDPPGVPLETYGRIYMLAPALANARGAR